MAKAKSASKSSPSKTAAKAPAKAKVAGKKAPAAKPAAKVAKPAAKVTKPAAKVTKPAAKPVAQKAPVAKAPAVKKSATKPVAAKAVVKAVVKAVKPAPVAKKPTTKASKKAGTAVVKKAPTGSVNKAKVAPAAATKAAKPEKAPAVSESALEPKANTTAAASSAKTAPATAAVKKTTTRKAKPDVSESTDRYEAAQPGTAVYARANAIAVADKGIDGSESPYSEKELKNWRAILMQKRVELTDDILDLRKDAMDSEDGHTTPNHIAERGSDADLQDLSLGMADQEEGILLLIDRALRKIHIGSPVAYGLCEHTSEAIAQSRLELMPWTPLSIEGAEYMEQNNLSIEDVLIED